MGEKRVDYKLQQIGSRWRLTVIAEGQGLAFFAEVEGVNGKAPKEFVNELTTADLHTNRMIDGKEYHVIGSGGKATINATDLPN